jgi:integrase
MDFLMKIPYLISKKLKSGKTSYYFYLPLKALKKHPDFPRCTPLGDDYMNACQKALNLYKSLRSEIEAQEINSNPKSLDFLWKEYQKSHFYNNITTATQKYYLYQYNYLAEIKSKSGTLFKETPLDSFSIEGAYSFYDKILATKGIHKAQACITFLKVIYNFGLRKEIFSGSNPFANLRLKKPKAKKEVISKDDIKQYCIKAREAGKDFLALAVELNYWLGQRVSDIRHLHRDNIKIINGKHFFNITQQKTNKNVILPIPDHLLEEVLSKKDYIVADGYGSFTKDRLAKAFRKFSDQCGIKLVFKQMRHTASTAYVEAGVTSAAAISITGHTNTQIFDSVYRADSHELSQFAYEQRKNAENARKNTPATALN